MRRTPIIALSLLLLLLAGFTAVWFVASDRLLGGVDRWAEKQRQRGWEVSWEERDKGGFPLAITGLFQEPRLADPKGWRWEGAALAATLSLLDWNRVELEGFGEQRFFWPGLAPAQDPATLAAQEKRAFLTYSDGDLSKVEVLAREADLSFSGRRASASSLEVAVIPPRDARRYDVPVDGEASLRATDLLLPSDLNLPLGEQVKLLDVAALLTGQLPPDGKIDRQAARAWAESGGVLDFDRLSLDWGPLTLRGEGTVTLDSLDRPLGAFTLRVKGLPETLEQLARKGLIDGGVAFAVQATALAMGETDPADGRRQVTLPLTLQDGWLSLGPPVGPLPLVRLQPLPLEP
ncbi:DUF2125 domain-containing protein [Limibacillus halophilus]